MVRQQVGRYLEDIYQRLLQKYGQQHWWPADEPFEVMVGAILTQQVSWKNAAKAIGGLKAVGALSPAAIRRMSVSELALIIHYSGYFNAKAKKLKSLANWLGSRYGDNLDGLFALDVRQMRREMLAVHGIGPETADSIILYAAARPVFVVDAYTRRVIDRLGWALADESYAACQRLFMSHLPADVGLFNEYHALLVQLAKDACRREPLCSRCCLNDICQFADYKNKGA
jgi:endonuclease-3 related protein